MTKVVAIWLILIGIFVTFIKCHEVFTALPDMETLLINELTTPNIIERYVQEEIERLEKLKGAVKQYKQFLKDGFSVIHSPVESYLLMKRMYTDWNDMEAMIHYNHVEALLFNLTSHRSQFTVPFPQWEDLKGAAIALMRLQDVYNIDVKDLTRGKIRGVKGISREEMTALDCFNFGGLAVSRSDFYHALIWLEEALKRVNLENPPTVKKTDILENLAYSLFQQGNFDKALQFTEEWFELDPHNERAKTAVDHYRHWAESAAANKTQNNDSEIRDKNQSIKNKRPYVGSAEKEAHYEALCRGEYGLSEAEKAKLYCYYKKDLPFLRLAPIKVEVVRWKPKMLIFRQIITDTEIDVIKKTVTDRLQTAYVVNKDAWDASATLEARAAKSGWLYTHEQIVADLNKRLDLMTDMDSTYSEHIHIVKYNIAGHYEPHYDFFNQPHTEESLKTNNDRMATLIFYLSTTEAGGATVFPELNVTFYPTKNDAVFWYNLHRNGTADTRTMHGACPVLSGVKWVGNKWIRERGQEFLRRCSLDQFEDE